MVDIIDFLERMGQDGSLRHAPKAILERAMRDAQIDPEARAALLSGARAGIEAVIGSGGSVCCLIHAPEDEEQADAPQPQKSQPQKAASGVDNDVCCMIYAPLPEGDEEADGAKRHKAA